MRQHLGVIGADAFSVLRVGPDEPLGTAAAKNGFPGMLTSSVRKMLVLKRCAMKDHPRGLLEMIAMLMRLHVPSMTNAEICAVLMKRAGIKKDNDVSKSLNASLHRCDVFAEACDSRDLKDDKDFFSSELKGYRVRAVTTMEWLKNKKWLGSKDLDNLAILKEDPVVMAKLRAREAALQKKTKKTAAVYKLPPTYSPIV